MNDDTKETQQNNGAEDVSAEKLLPVHNPFEKGNDKPISQEDIDNEQKLKEAMSERD